MPYPTPLHQKPTNGRTEGSPVRQAASVRRRTRLLAELQKQLVLFRDQSSISPGISLEAESHADPIDQASVELDQGLALQIKMRTRDKLRRIERALALLQTSKYGLCRRCKADIPYKRLRVQPDALYCVPCLTLFEQNALNN